MVNTLSILIAHAALVFVAVRALMLDSQLPWFEGDEERAKREAEEKAADDKPAPRRAQF